jgi:hypothetical protein
MIYYLIYYCNKIYFQKNTFKRVTSLNMNILPKTIISHICTFLHYNDINNIKITTHHLHTLKFNKWFYVDNYINSTVIHSDDRIIYKQWVRDVKKYYPNIKISFRLIITDITENGHVSYHVCIKKSKKKKGRTGCPR